jgi:hypothetical protein
LQVLVQAQVILRESQVLLHERRFGEAAVGRIVGGN